MIRCWASPSCHDVSSPISVSRYDEESGLRWVDVKLIVRPLKVNATSSAERPPLSSRGSLASIGKRDRIMLPIPLAEPDNVANFQYHVFPVFSVSSAAIVTGSSVLWLQLSLRSISLSEMTSGLNFAIQVT